MRGKVFPAPYIPDPHRLVAHATVWPHAAFARLCDPASPGHKIDIFYAGHTICHQGIHRPESPNRWQRSYQAMLHPDDPPAPLIGYFSYEFGYQFEAERWQDLPIMDQQPMFAFLAMDVWYQVDHTTRTAAIHALSDTRPDTIRIFTDYLRDCMDRTSLQPDETATQPNLDPYRVAEFGELLPAEYQGTVERILDDINAGRYYELNFTQRFEARSGVSPELLFQRLMKQLNPAYAFYGNFNGETIVSASPELFLHKRDTLLQTCPIKGSFRQAPTSVEAAKLAAEHTMVVDLARNDLGRISDVGWVSVAEQAARRQFGEISHLESRILGHTSHGLPDILSATMPAASITGNPKVITVQAIAEYEQSPRGAYTGSCGILWPDGDLQLNVAIRTLRATPAPADPAAPMQWHYTLGAGGAITADSDPKEEYIECLMKATPLLTALNPK